MDFRPIPVLRVKVNRIMPVQGARTTEARKEFHFQLRGEDWGGIYEFLLFNIWEGVEGMVSISWGPKISLLLFIHLVKKYFLRAFFVYCDSRDQNGWPSLLLWDLDSNAETNNKLTNK